MKTDLFKVIMSFCLLVCVVKVLHDDAESKIKNGRLVYTATYVIYYSNNHKTTKTINSTEPISVKSSRGTNSITYYDPYSEQGVSRVKTTAPIEIIYNTSKRVKFKYKQ